MIGKAHRAELLTAQTVNRSLGKLFVISWLLVSTSLLGALGGEIRQHGLDHVVIAVAPPITPLVVLFWADYGGVLFWGSLSLLTAAAWLAAAKYPESFAKRLMARTAIVCYWLVMWIVIGLSA